MTDQRSATMRKVPIDWEALEDAFENNAPEVHSYLHVGSGDVLRVVDGVADPQMHARIAADNSYLRIEPVSSREQYRWMERFIEMLEPGELHDELALAIDGRGAFRRFKDVLMLNPTERESWFAFRSERLKVFMDAWLQAHAIEAVERVVPSVSTPPETASVPPRESISPRRSRSPELLRKNIRDIAATLGVRDLDRILTFAEFVKSRRAARSYSLRAPDPATGRESLVAPPDSSLSSATLNEQAAECSRSQSEGERRSSSEGAPPTVPSSRSSDD